MKDVSKTRIFIIVAVTLLSLWFIYPTTAYYFHLRHEPAMNGPRPAALAPEPAKDNLKEHTAWEQQNPELIKWREANAEYVKWEARGDELRAHAIPLGLDLMGGVDVTLVLDREKAVADRVASLMESIRRDFEREKLNARLELIENGKAFTLNLENKANARQAANLLNGFSSSLDGALDEASLAAGTPVRLTAKADYMTRELTGSVEGAKRGIDERVNSLGVTQPRVTMQGNDHIRVQVPGERDPDKLIATVIRPAQLEFRMVHQDNDTLIDRTTGNLRPGATLPLGTELVTSKIGDMDSATGKIVYQDPPQHFVVSKQANVTGTDLQTAGVTYNPNDIQNPVQVSLEFNNDGAKKFGDLTTRFANQERQLAILLDGVLRSAPRINDPITDGRCMIYGGFTNEEASDLAQILKAGSLKAPLKIESKRTVGATVGADSVKSGVAALVLGSLIVGVFMWGYYGTAGFIAIIALILNILIVLAIMALTRSTLTLSGIGGILLTIGMAVDANVLIYERMREELRAGRPLRQAINLGFNRALGVIVDSNLTTLLTAMVLLQFTEGSVFGFALTMTFGLLANLFTGLTVTYTLCQLWYGWRGTMSLGALAMFKNCNYDFIKIRWFTISISLAVIVISSALIAARGGINYGVDFEGGFRAEVQFADQVADGDLRQALLDAGLRDPNVQRIVQREAAANATNGVGYIVDVKMAKAVAGSDLSELQQTEKIVRDTLQQKYPGKHEVTLTTGFGAQSGKDFSELAITVVILASIAILIYMWVRFEWYFGVATVAALVHDVLIAILVSQLWGVQISLEVVAGLLVLMGFSCNDTIVIFDRIREDARGVYGKSFREICNMAMNQSVSRTIITSGTVLLVVLVLYFVGGEGLREFSKVYLIGVIAGTYSTGFIAAPLVYMWNNYKKNQPYIELSTRKKRVEAAKPIGRTPGAATRPATGGAR